MRARSLVALLAGLALAPPVHAAGGARFALAWPPTRYRSAELILWLDDAAQPATVRVRGRGIDTMVVLDAPGARRVPLPQEARCLEGVDACAIVAERVAGAGAFSAALQSPDTAGAADTLLLTAHDTVLLEPDAEAATGHVVLAMPNPAAAAFPESASFATIVPASWPARVQAGAGCAGAVEVVLVNGEALTLACDGAAADVSGTRVDCDVPAVILSGNVVTQVPCDGGSGLSGDLVMDTSPAARVGATSLIALPVPRSAATRGLGDVVRIVALAGCTASATDDLGGSVVRTLSAGEVWDIDTAAAGRDRVLRVDADGPIAAWHVLKSRALRGLGDAAAIPLVPRHGFTRRARFFMPDGYGEANVLAIVAEAGANVRLDGVVVAGFAAAPGGDLEVVVVDLPPPASGSGSVHELEADAPFGAWTAGLGGFKAHGMVAAIAPPPPPGTDVSRGVVPDALAIVTRVPGRDWCDADAGSLVFYSVSDDAALLRVGRRAGDACLAW